MEPWFKEEHQIPGAGASAAGWAVLHGPTNDRVVDFFRYNDVDRPIAVQLSAGQRAVPTDRFELVPLGHDRFVVVHPAGLVLISADDAEPDTVDVDLGAIDPAQLGAADYGAGMLAIGRDPAQELLLVPIRFNDL